MKKFWVMPQAEVERFELNEYISTCGTTKSYIFNCNAPAGSIYAYEQSDIPYSHMLDVTSVNWNDLHAYSQGSFTPCADANELARDVIITDPATQLYWGVIDYNGNQLHDPEETLVVYFDSTGNGHATKDLDVTTWETAKS